MKSLLVALILISAFCAVSLAQTNQTVPCPTISVTGPTGISAPGETMTFTVSITTENSLSYDWTTSAGTIIEGQNSSVIKIATTPEMADSEITVTVEVKGITDGCKKIASETGLIALGCGLVTDFDEYERISLREERLRLARVAGQLAEQPATSAFFVIYFPKKQTLQSKKKYLEKISNTLYQMNKIPKNRLVFIIGEAETRRTRIIIVPDNALNMVTKSEKENIKKN